VSDRASAATVGDVNLARVLATGRHWWPRACLLCEQPAEHGALCKPCAGALPGAARERCPVCAAPLRASAAAAAACRAAPSDPGTGLHAADCADCARLNPAFAATLAAADYRSPLAEAILALKFGGQTNLASGCGLLLAAALRRTAAVAPSERQTWEVDCLVPIPLAHARLAERGFNQAEMIAAALRRHWPETLAVRGPPLRCRWLARRRETQRQTALGGAARRLNLDSGFVAAPAAAGAVVALVDDVMTTGATLDAAARALRAAGARAVVAMVVARTP